MVRRNVDYMPVLQDIRRDTGAEVELCCNLTEEVWPDFSKLTNLKLISFGKIKNPIGLDFRGIAARNLPILVSELRVPLKHTTEMITLRVNGVITATLTHIHTWRVNGGDYRDINSYSYMQDFDPTSVTNTNGFAIQFS
ncbi:hypothetical protein LIER_29697 [Lithospermum erythrorhizon]|uniref:Uncharacterized protein n=1 Tax=Lithospermum erythrorhizon TaxID=34254 RepID=A0AAV3RQY8_LITER